MVRPLAPPTRKATSVKPKRKSATPASIAGFVFLWGFTGFALGTLVLMFPVRWWATTARESGLSDRVEKAGVLVFIVLLVVVSATISWKLASALRSRGWFARVAIAAIVVACGGVAYWFWINPTMMAGGMGAEVTSAQFTFGPYPNEDRMRQLKKQGFTIVPLLHPAVVPFEPQLLEREKLAAEKVGIPLIHVPMLPWVSENLASIEKIKELAADKSKKYYVHCYLGKDRVQMVKNLVEKTGATVAAETTYRGLNTIDHFERGRIYKLGKEGYLTPYPTEAEFTSFFLSGEVKQVVALLDPDDPGDSKRLTLEREILARFNVPFELIPAKKGTYDAEAVLDAVRRVRQMPKPYVVHAFFTPGGTRSSSWAEGFLQSWYTNRETLPPTMFAEPLANGTAAVVVPHVAIGPQPKRNEFQELARRGVKECIFLGTDAPKGDSSAAKEAGLAWRIAATADEVARVVATGGPYYVYGGDATPLSAALRKTFAPAIPGV